MGQCYQARARSAPAQRACVLRALGLLLCMGWESCVQGAGLVRGDLQLHLHQEDSVMVGEDLVYFSF